MTPSLTKEQLSAPLHNFWYVACGSDELTPRQTLHRQLLGEPVLIGRDSAGQVFAFRDTCPHRGTLLSRGAFDGQEVECPYHGWRFGTDGRCTAIPSLTSEDEVDVAAVHTRPYPAVESDGVIWVYVGAANSELPEVPCLPDVGFKHRLHLSMLFDCPIDLAVMGLMDPAHGAYVHASHLWRKKRDSHQKTKSFSPTAFGWRMDRHAASSNSKAYQLFFGGRPETEISYQLPSVRIEHAELGKHHYGGLTVCTPISKTQTMVHHLMAWSLPGGPVLKPIARLMGRRFLGQDRDAVVHMRDGQLFDPPMMWMRDADQQARWYLKLKKTWLEAEASGDKFQNPIEKQDLSWVS